MIKSTEKDLLQNRSKDKNCTIFTQIIKLTKENQYLHVKIDALYQHIDQVIKLKEKYKTKYKTLKELMKKEGVKNNKIEEQLPSEHKLDREYNPISEEAHPYLILPEHSDYVESMFKIRENVELLCVRF